MHLVVYIGYLEPYMLFCQNLYAFYSVNFSLRQVYLYCMDIFKPSGMIQRSVINEASKIGMLKFSNLFFSKFAQW